MADSDWKDAPSKYCDLGCTHADVRTCKGLRHHACVGSQINHLESAEKVQHTLVHDLWEVRKSKGYVGNGTGAIPRGIGNAKVQSLRETIAGNVTFRCVTQLTSREAM